MDLYQLLRQDHQKVKRLFERIDDTFDATTKSRERLFGELKQELELHSEMEERHFYPALEQREELRDLVEDAREEHEEMAELLAALDEGDKDEEEWASQLEELRETVETHVEEEEGEIFPKAQELLDQGRTEAIARAIEQDKAAAKAR
jgi:iron-sulfur cluster repair protein YtfE (RIC family)